MMVVIIIIIIIIIIYNALTFPAPPTELKTGQRPNMHPESQLQR
jgi:hypothetical protein